MQARVLENAPIARDTYRIRLASLEIARTILPGQFVMIKPGETDDPLLGRPFALYDVEGDAIDVVYQVVGRGTAALARRRAGDSLSVWGPLGNGFGPPPNSPGEIVFIAGGIGQTPFLALAKAWLLGRAYGGSRYPDASPQGRSASLLYGVRTADFLACVPDFQALGLPVEISTDDGSAGFSGRVTAILSKKLENGLRPALIVGCGPGPMLAALSTLVEQYKIPGLVSLENHMACGFGVCFSCVAPIRQADGSIDLKRVCVEGPVFSAAETVWA